jgi:hypothetical protein
MIIPVSKMTAVAAVADLMDGDDNVSGAILIGRQEDERCLLRLVGVGMTSFAWP